ncbi:penicillin-binding protein 2 [Solicola sp. PLA-1-18]|uniref:penicillin-binding protein 2 n=1 Tax=Solicola sp. PLA-1-18 TaxID=3380532 RepID=UPI003B785222
MSRLTSGRFLVVQVLVLALFCTLLGRLWFLQVVGGESYQAQAADNAVRDVVVQPQRGLVVDDMGRVLAANRLSWVVTIDRSALSQQPEADQRTVLTRLAGVLDTSYDGLLQRTKLCGEDGAPEPPVCWNGSPYEPVPVAQDVPDDVALSIQERAEDFPAVAAEERNVRSYPGPDGVNAAHVLGYVSGVTEDEYDQALKDRDTTLNASSLVGRSGLERSYDSILRGVPGTTGKQVDSGGRVIGEGEATAPTPGDTVVTSIDSKVQSVVESELEKSILKARGTRDKITGRDYEASSGAAIVLDPKTGRLIASASYPTYDPGVWAGGISAAQLKRLYSTKAGEPLLSRPTQAQLAPGSTFKPFMTAGALENGYKTSTRLNCSSSFQVGNRSFKNFESGAYGSIGFDKALQVSCNTFFYRVAYGEYRKHGADPTDVDAADPLVTMAQKFGFGSTTGIDLPGEASGRIADRTWRRSYWEQNKDYYCKQAKKSTKRDFAGLFAREFCAEGWYYRAGDAVNFAIGQGDTMVTPIQLATAYGALANGGTLWEPRAAKAVVSQDGTKVREIEPKAEGRVPVSKKRLKYIDTALKGTAKPGGTIAWKFGDFPLDDVQIRAKTGTAEVQGKQTTGWVATYDENYVVVMMIEQGGTGSGSSGDSVRAIWEKLYGITDGKVDRSKALLPDAKAPAALPTFAADGSIKAPGAAR